MSIKYVNRGRSSDYSVIPEWVTDSDADVDIPTDTRKPVIAPSTSSRKALCKQHMLLLDSLNVDIASIVGIDLYSIAYRLLIENESASSLAEIYGVSYQTISNKVYGSKGSVYSKLRSYIARNGINK